MQRYYILILLILSVTLGCDDSPRNDAVFAENGEIFGTITNVETGEPVEGASVYVNGNSILTDKKGKYLLEDMPFSDNLSVVITASEYKEYKATISLHQELFAFDVSLTPVESQLAQVLAVFNGLSRDIESLDPGKIPSIQSSYFSRDYTTANDDATLLGVFFGVVPPNYDGIPGTIANVIEQYRRLEFGFADPDIELKGDSALMHAHFTAIVESYPPDPKRWELIVNCRFDLRRENGDWKIIYWQLIPPFVKFVEIEL